MSASSLRVTVLLLLAGAASACGASATSESSTAGASDPAANAGTAAPAPPSGSAERAIAEADIIQLDEARGLLYAMSKSGTLAVVDVSQPGRLAVVGKTRLPGEPFEMYRRGDVLLTMTNGAIAPDGSPVPITADEDPSAPRDLSAGAIVTALDVATPANMRPIESFKIAGQIADSRLVGDVLYLATYESGTCFRCTSGARTLVTSFDVSSATALEPIDQVAFTGAAPSWMNAAWATPWKRSIVVTPERMYVGGLTTSAMYTKDEGILEVLDIRDPHGKLVRGATIATAGPMLSRWQVDENQGVLRVISQPGAGGTSNGTAYPRVQTFHIESSSSFTPLGGTTLSLPRQEGLKTVRFDGSRAYAITFNQTDPLFTIDLSDPAQPVQRGELHMPGWMFHLEPRGDRVIGIGLDRTDRAGNLNLSLFDVSNLDDPRLLRRVSFGPTNMYEDYQITTEVLAEDQDRIQKALLISDDGLVAVPFSSGRGCASGSGVQLVEWSGDSLSKRALLPMAGHPRRAIRRSAELIAVSDSNVRSFSLARTDVAAQTADVAIGTCATQSAPWSSGASDVEERPRYTSYGDASYGRPRYACAVSTTDFAPSGSAWPFGLLVMFGAAACARRRRRA